MHNILKQDVLCLKKTFKAMMCIQNRSILSLCSFSPFLHVTTHRFTPAKFKLRILKSKMNSSAFGDGGTVAQCNGCKLQSLDQQFSTFTKGTTYECTYESHKAVINYSGFEDANLFCIILFAS